MTKEKAEAYILVWGGRELVVDGKVVACIVPPYSPGRKGGLVENTSRKTGWKYYSFERKGGK